MRQAISQILALCTTIIAVRDQMTDGNIVAVLLDLNYTSALVESPVAHPQHSADIDFVCGQTVDTNRRVPI